MTVLSRRTADETDSELAAGQARREEIAQDVQTWTNQLTAADERQGQLLRERGVRKPSAADTKALEEIRAQRAGLRLKIDEGGLELAAVDERLAELAAERAAAHRAAQRTAALACIAGAERAAAAVDAVAPAFVRALEEFLLAHREAVQVLGRINPRARYDLLETELSAVALWRLSGMLEFPGATFISDKERVPLEVFTSRFYRGARERLTREVAENGVDPR